MGILGIFRRDVAQRSGSRSAAIAAELDRLRSGPAMPPARRGARRFDAAVVDRLTASWLTTNLSIDFELRQDLNRLRNRARDMAKNNGYAKKFLRMVRNNVVGPDGFRLQCRAADPNGDKDAAANKAIEAWFARWCMLGVCEITGKFSFVDSCRVLATTLARDGEILVRHVRGAGKYGYQFQLLDVARLDTLYNVAPSGKGNAIIMGVEVDQYRRPVAYYLFTSPQIPGDYTRYRERVPADEIIHAFIAEEPEQTRGFPWMHAGMRESNDLKGYREAAVIAARVGASKMGFWTSPDGQPPPADGETTDTDGEEVFIDKVSPGEIGVAPAGYKFEKFDPDYPHDQFDAFCKATLRGIAGAWGVSYNSLANDLEGVNFSSIRSGVLEERDEWTVIQNWFAGAVLMPIFRSAIEMALLKGAITLSNGSPLPAQKLEKFNEHLWQGRRWSWVDPYKDIQASVLAILNGLASPQQVAAQSGRDIEDVLDEIAQFQAWCKAKGIELKPGTGKPDATNTDTPDPADDGADAAAPTKKEPA
jgi:lambda family phage portal protein